MKICFTVVIHEIKKLLFDKKMLLSVFLFPFIGVMAVVMMSYKGNSVSQSEYYNIYILGETFDEQIIEQSEDISVKISCVKNDSAKKFIESSKFDKTDVLVEITESGNIIYFNSTNDISYSLSQFAEKLLRTFYQENFFTYYDIQNIADIKITDLGIDKNIQNVMLALLLPYMLVLLLFTNVSNYTCDTIAGEKERGVFEKTLLAPVSVSSVIWGKIFSSTVCGFVSSIIYMGTLITGSVFCELSGNEDLFGFSGVTISMTEVLLIFIYAILLCYLFSSIAVLCSLYAKTSKEARAMLLPFMGISMMLSLLSMFRTGAVSTIMYALPLYNICLIFQDILNSTINIQNMFIVAGSLLFCSIIIFCSTLIVYNKENIRY